MPILTYRCIECGKEFSKIFFSPDAAPRACPVCGASEPVELGPTFHADEQLTARLTTAGCNSCSDDGGCTVSGST